MRLRRLTFHEGKLALFRAAIAALTACALVAGGALLGPTASRAWADDVYTATAIGVGSNLPKTDIERMEDAVKDASAGALRISVKTAACQRRIATLETKIPIQQQRSDDALRELYKLQESKYDLIEMLLEADSLDDLIKRTEYLENVGKTNLDTINRLVQMKQHLDDVRATLDAAKAEQDAKMQDAVNFLAAARADRVARHAAGVANSQSQAVSMGGEGSVGKDGAGNDQPEDFRIAASTETAALDDGADWNMSREEFIAAWAPRLDAYLAGSPLYGQGANFANSAWRYGIDPRWSAAISNTESSKGAICIRPHNAWGWGAADSDPYNLASEWGSWEEAIDAHAAGLAKGYGYTISIVGAKAYCPMTWQSWYNNTLREMARI